VHSLLLVPMRVRGAPIGSMTLFRSRPGHAYGEADQSLLQDIADRAALAVENAHLHASLEHRVAARTADLQAAMSELEAFSYSVSHDLRAPLRSIDGFSQALLEDCADRLDADGKAHLQRVREAARHMSTLIDALLGLSKVTRSDVHSERVDLSALARSVLARLAEAEPSREVETRVEEGMVVDADLRLLDIVLTNLIGNAWKFTSKRERAQIEIASLPGAPRAFFVRDNGAGFDAAYAGKLFGAFQRLHSPKEFAGTGIGLATVQRIVRRHGGRIWAEGEVGRGATFSFTLDA
jgi:light-regulated signal transduction histidine kinase (bacteriophytochrome)